MNKPNIVLRAPVFSQSGYGAHSRDIAISLWNSQKFNIAILPTQWGGSTNTADTIPVKDKEVLLFMCNNVIHKYVPFIFVHVGIPSEFTKVGNLNVGITAGLESNKIPKEWVDKCNLMDLVIVPSNFQRDVFKNSGVTAKIAVVEEGVDTSIFNNNPVNSDVFVYKLLDDLPCEKNLLGVGQWLQGGIGEDRKGIGLLINLFVKTFENNKKVGLVLKTQISNNSSYDYYHIQQRIKSIKGNALYPKITLLHGNLTDEEMSIIYKHPKITGFVSLTSGEGWGRSIAEAVACDLPVAVTGWSGHMHFINPKYFNVIDFDLKPVSAGALSTGFFTSDMIWAYPNIEDAKKKIKDLIDNEEENRKKAKEAGEIFRKSFSKESTYSKLIDLFSNLSQSLISKSSLGNILTLDKV
jgi:glycosyltransferase involved in cell wall biosynthesis